MKRKESVMDRNGFAARRQGEQGFTLIEALVAIVILIFGLAAVANLMVVAGSSNAVGNHSTAAGAAATQQMELIKSVPYNALPVGAQGSIDVDTTPTNGECGVTPVTAAFNCDTRTDFAGVGTMHVRWQIGAAVPVGTTTTRFIQVSAESRAQTLARRSRVVLTTFRTDNP